MINVTDIICTCTNCVYPGNSIFKIKLSILHICERPERRTCTIMRGRPYITQRKRVIKHDFDCRCGCIRYGPILNPVSVHGMGEGRRGLSKVSFSKIYNINHTLLNYNLFLVNI